MNVMPIRVQALKLKYDNSFVYVSAMLLDRSPYEGISLLARLHEVHRAIVVTSVVSVYVYLYVRVTLSVKVFYKSISLDHVDGSS